MLSSNHIGSRRCRTFQTDPRQELGAGEWVGCARHGAAEASFSAWYVSWGISTQKCLLCCSGEMRPPRDKFPFPLRILDSYSRKCPGRWSLALTQNSAQTPLLCIDMILWITGGSFLSTPPCTHPLPGLLPKSWPICSLQIPLVLYIPARDFSQRCVWGSAGSKAPGFWLDLANGKPRQETRSRGKGR